MIIFRVRDNIRVRVRVRVKVNFYFRVRPLITEGN